VRAGSCRLIGTLQSINLHGGESEVGCEAGFCAAEPKEIR